MSACCARQQFVFGIAAAQVRTAIRDGLVTGL